MCGEIYWNEDPGRGRPELDGGGEGEAKKTKLELGVGKQGEWD